VWALGLLFLLHGVPVSAQDVDPHFRSNAREYNQTGLGLMHDERYPEAIAMFQQALRLNPGSVLSASIYNNLGMAYRTLGQTPLALISFQHACRLQPGFALYHRNLARTYAMAGLLADAIRLLTENIEANDNDAEAWFLLGLIYREGGDIDAARQAFKTFLELAPHSPLADAARH
jgi:tetratricopeptide (TPR) repeat protein